jgi:hypothetical protein
MLRNAGAAVTGSLLFNTAVFRSTLEPSYSPNGYGGGGLGSRSVTQTIHILLVPKHAFSNVE